MSRKSFISFLLFAFSLFILVGCERNQEDTPESDRQVVVNLTSKSLSASLLKSAATNDEELISKIVFFGVDGQGNVVQSFPEIENPSLSGIELTISKKVRLLYVIANPSTGMEIITPSTDSDLGDMTGNFSNSPQSPFLMSGKGEVNSNNVNVNIELIRTVAKINFIGKNGFQIESVTVKNTPDEGYVFKKETLLVPSSASMKNYPAINSSPEGMIVYVPENSKLNPTEFLVTGQLQSQEVTYTFYLKSGGNPIDLVRNTRYEVSITPVTDSECSINTTIPAWDDVAVEEEFSPYDDPPANPYQDGIKILAIGNSYSENSMQYMFDLLKQLEVDEENKGNIILVNAYISGASLEVHATNARNNTPGAYKRQRFVSHGQTDWPSLYFSLEELIQQEKWDVITLQEASWYSGLPEYYDEDLDFLIEYVRTHATNPDFKLGWHMTWAHTQDYIEQNQIYNNSQRFMYESICNAVQTKIAVNDAFDFIIPTGTAIQNAQGYFAGNLHYDGTHLNGLGCYIASTMWIKKIIGYDIAKLTTPYVTYDWANIPYTIDEEDLKKIVLSVNAAISWPFESL